MHRQKSQLSTEVTDLQSVVSLIEQKFKHLEKVISKETKSELPETIQPSEVCAKFGWSRSKFEQFKRSGLFRTNKIGGKVYVSIQDLKNLFPKDF
ncbi:hypothetical protein [Lacihabitans lacunae]|jgi:hypothetical protein|uniref:DNA-binding protein n=1 Tax=Lacihabitans lacunae TaxID=1028214 RepID=A0ABV7Z0U8_9BACT